MTIELLFPTLPPAVDGIGDYTTCLASALEADGHSVRLRAGRGPIDVPDLDVVAGYDFSSFSDARRLYDDVRAAGADWVVVQYNPFSYGPRGFNLALPRMLRWFRADANAPRLAVMVHEPFVPVMNWKFALMSTWQRWQFRAICQAAEVAFFSIEPWADRFRPWFPNTRVHHLPVGSNMPRQAANAQVVRREYGIGNDDLVIGVFGSAHPSRLLPFVQQAVVAARQAVPASREVRVLYVGTAGDAVREALNGAAPLVDAGRLDAADVSRAFAAMDLYCAPFRKGVSTRRGSFMTGLQHGVATASTTGIHTDACLQNQHDQSLVLAPDDDPEAYASLVAALAADADRRQTLAAAGQAFFDDHFSWDQIARRMVSLLDEPTKGTSAPSRTLSASVAS